MQTDDISQKGKTEPPYEYFLRKNTWSINEACLLVCGILRKFPNEHDFPKDSKQAKLRQLVIDAIHSGGLEVVDCKKMYFLEEECYEVFPERFIQWAKSHVENIPDVLSKSKSFAGIFGTGIPRIAVIGSPYLINPGIPPTEDEIWFKEIEQNGGNPLLELILRDSSGTESTPASKIARHKPDWLEAQPKEWREVFLSQHRDADKVNVKIKGYNWQTFVFG